MKNLLLLSVLFAGMIANAQNYKFLGEYTADGTPLYLEQPGDIVNSSSLELIDNALPESYPVPDYNPHYISSGYDTDITLSEDAEIWVTFVQEGAGYRNVLGFYTYQGNTPPSSIPANKNITIIFPNVSGVGSGGGLNTGDKVKLGAFSAGTSIGWILLANGWNGSSVTAGNAQLFSNPDYNPEGSASLRQHNVLLFDEKSDRIFLGFEDIRRDYSSCDNDFNDAIFYVTANPITAIETVNITDIKSASTVSSANDGGLESNGSLAGLIANRNFIRTKNNLKTNQKIFQRAFDKSALELKSAGQELNLEHYIPESGMFGNETAHISSPEDLVGITNAVDVFSADYYIGENRVAAILSTQTEGSVYDHTKVICDRLNGSGLEDIRTVRVKGHQIISTKIKRSGGQIENSISFSIKIDGTQNELHSYWHTADYPEGDYFNFQIWGASFSQVFALANQIIDRFSAEKTLESQAIEASVPKVFVKSAYYFNSEIHLNIVNKAGADFLKLAGSVAYSESSEREEISQSIGLSGEYYDSVSVFLGSLFDVGLSLSANGSEQNDVVYLADGSWGLDYLSTDAAIESFWVENNEPLYELSMHQVERQPKVSGSLKGTVNLFRQLLPGKLSLDVSVYNILSFSVLSSHPLEIVLMTDDLENWDNRLRTTIPASGSITDYQISFNDFVDGQGKPGTVEKINRVVFSVQGNYQDFSPFSIEIENMAFISNVATAVVNIQDLEHSGTVQNFPNPFQSETYFLLKDQIEKAEIKVYDISGRLIDVQYLQNHTAGNGLRYRASGLNAGVYSYVLTGDKNTTYTGKFVIQ